MIRLPRALPTCFAGALALAGASAWAGAPMVTEDANLLAPSECEWESVGTRARAGGSSARGLGTKVGCGWFSGTQLALGAVRVSAEGGSTSGFGLSGKTALVPRAEGGFGLALAYGFSWVKQPGSSLAYDATALALVASQGFGAVTVHGNLGVTRFRDGSGSQRSWALGAEWALSEQVDLLGETFGTQGSKPSYGAGLRWKPLSHWSFGLMAAQTRDRPKANTLTLTATLAF